MFIRMSGKWYYQEFRYLESKTLRENMRSHIENGTIVAFADDLEGFADEMEIEVDDLELVEPEKTEDTE